VDNRTNNEQMKYKLKLIASSFIFSSSFVFRKLFHQDLKAL